MIRPNILCFTKDMTRLVAFGDAIVQIHSTTKWGSIVEEFPSETYAPSSTACAEV